LAVEQLQNIAQTSVSPDIRDATSLLKSVFISALFWFVGNLNITYDSFSLKTITVQFSQSGFSRKESIFHALTEFKMLCVALLTKQLNGLRIATKLSYPKQDE